MKPRLLSRGCETRPAGGSPHCATRKCWSHYPAYRRDAFDVVNVIEDHMRRVCPNTWVVAVVVRVTAAFLLLSVAACSHKAPAKADWPLVRLGYQRVGPYRAFFVAQEKGFFREEQVRVEGIEFPSSNVMGQAQLAGKIDGSGFMSFPVVFAMEQDAPGQSVCYLILPMTAQSRYSAVIVPAASKVTTPEQLRGLKLGVYPSSTNVIYAKMMLERLFGSSDAAQVIQIEPPNQFTLLASGGIDALIGPDPMPATALARNIGRVLVYSPDARYVMDPMPVGCGSFARAFHDQHPEAAKRVQRAMEHAVDYLREPKHRAEVQSIVARRAGIDAAVVGQLGDIDYWKLSEADPSALQRLADLLEKEHVLSRHVATAALLLHP